MKKNGFKLWWLKGGKHSEVSVSMELCRLDRQDDAGGISRKAMKGFLSKLQRLVYNFAMLMLLKQNGNILGGQDSQ